MTDLVVKIKGQDESGGAFASFTRHMAMVNARLRAVNEPVERLKKQVKQFGENSGIAAAAEHAKKLRERMRDVYAESSRVFPALAAIGGLASIGGMSELVNSWSELGEDVEHVSARIGLGAGRLASWRGAAQLAGSAAGALDQGLIGLGDTMKDAIAGRRPEAMVMFNTLRLGFRDIRGQALPVDQMFLRVADRISAIRDPYLQARAASVLFGGASENLLPLLRRGAAGMEQLRQQSEKYGAINEAGAAASSRFRQQGLVPLQQALEGVRNTIAARLEPVLTPLFGYLANWLGQHRADIGKMADDFGQWLKNFDWARFRAGLGGIGKDIEDIVDFMGGWKNALELLMGLMAARWVAAMVTPLTAYIRLLRTVPGALGAVGTGARALFSGMAREAGTASAAIGAEGLGGALLDAAAAIEATPVGWILTGLTAIGLGAYEAATHWTGFKNAIAEIVSPFGEVWREMKQFFAWLDPKIDRLMKAIGLEWVRDQFDAAARPPDAAVPGVPAASHFTGSAGHRGAAPAANVLAPDIEKAVRMRAAQLGLDEGKMVALFRAEGGGYDNVSAAGAIGPAQLMPATAKDLGIDPHDWRQNVDGGERYFKQLLDRFGGNYAAAQAAYNAGPNADAVRVFAQTGDASRLPPETRHYLATIAGYAAQAQSQASGQPVAVSSPAPDYDVWAMAYFRRAPRNLSSLFQAPQFQAPQFQAPLGAALFPEPSEAGFGNAERLFGAPLVVPQAQGAPLQLAAAPGQTAASASGAVDVTVRFDNPPLGLRSTVKSSGDLLANPKIERGDTGLLRAVP